MDSKGKKNNVHNASHDKINRDILPEEYLQKKENPTTVINNNNLKKT
jgi:hypothetical protein